MVEHVGHAADPQLTERLSALGSDALELAGGNLGETGKRRHTMTVPADWDLDVEAANIPSRPTASSDHEVVGHLFQEYPVMSYRCEICGKEPSYGKTVSFSHKRNNRRWLPNIQKIRVKHGSNTRRARVCTSCIRAGKVVKA
jgi:large subunit ribosomal protein L28